MGDDLLGQARRLAELLSARGTALDWNHVRHWAARLDVTARLEEALRDADL